jgi:hypothetical protein
MQQIEIEPPIPIVVGINGARLGGGVCVFAFYIFGLAAKPVVTLDVLEHDIFNDVAFSQAEYERTTTTKDHSLRRTTVGNIRVDSLR